MSEPKQLRKPKVGQTVYKVVSSGWGETRKFDLKAFEVRRVGSKYFYIGPENQWNRNSGQDGIEYCQIDRNQDVFFSEQEYYDLMETNSMIDLLEKFFRNNSIRSLDLSTMRQIHELIKPFIKTP